MTDAAGQSNRGRTVAWGSVAALAQMLSGIVRNKALSAALGPAGIGVIAEAQQFATTAMVPAAALSGPALTREVALAQTGDSDPRPALDTLLTMGLGYSVVVIGAVVPLMRAVDSPWTRFEMLVVVLPLLTAAATALGGGLGQALIAAGLVEKQARPQAISAVFSAALAGVLAFPYGIAGALVGALVGQLLAMGQILVHCIGRPELRHWRPRLRVDPRFIIQSIQFGATGLVAAAALQASLLAVRTALGTDDSSEFNGLFQASWAMGYTYLGLVFSGFTSYFFPKIAAAEPGEATTRETSLGASFLLALVVPMVLVAIPLRDFALQALYSAEFLGATTLLGIQLSTAPLRALGVTFGGSLLFQGRLRSYAILELSAAAIHGIGAVYAFPRWGLTGVGIAYLLSYLWYAWGAWLIVTQANGLTHARLKEPMLASVATGLLACGTLLPQAPSALGSSISLIGAAALGFVAKPIIQSLFRRNHGNAQ